MGKFLEINYCTAGSPKPSEWHQQLEFVYVLEGQLTLGVEQQVLQLEEEEIFIIPSGMSHYYLSTPATEYLLLNINPRQFNEFLSLKEAAKLKETIAHLENHSKNWPLQIQRELRAIITDIYESEEMKPAFYQLRQVAAVAQLFLVVANEVPQTATALQKISSATLDNQEIIANLERVYQYIDDNYAEKINIADVAAILNISATHFSRFFKKNVGLSFQQFLNEYRINKAKYILANQRLPMSEVAEKSGFSSEKTFHRVFKEQTGLPPLKYQKLLIGKK